MTTHIARILLNVGDIPRSQKFFADVLGFRKSRVPPFTPAPLASAVMALGDQAIELVQHDPPGAPYPPGSTACDLWFQHFAVVTSDMGEAARRLREANVVPISREGPQSLPPDAGNVTAYKFRDPDGHPLELIEFPRRAHASGIDHTAISVADAERSIAFYKLLGFDVTARQTNSGVAQDRLDGLKNVSVDVVALSIPGAPPPHLELLCYHTPRGRALSVQGRHDIADTRLVLAHTYWRKLSAAFEAAGYSVARDTHSAFLRDPDGHGLILTAT